MDDFCFCELAPLYALNLLGDRDRHWVETQVAECPDLAPELEDFQTAVAALGYSAAPAPMASDLKARLFQRLQVEPDGELDAQHAGEPEGERVGTALSQPTISQPAPAPDRTESLNSPVWLEQWSGLVVRAEDLTWQAHPAPGVQVAIFHHDPVERKVIGLLKAAAGVRYPFHRHADVEEIFMLDGDLAIDGQVYGKGAYIRSAAGSVHGPETQYGCMFFFRACMDDDYLYLVRG